MKCRFKKLKGRIIEKHDSILAFANTMQRSRASVYNKLSGATDFSKEDIVKWCEVLEIPMDQITEYFF